MTWTPRHTTWAAAAILVLVIVTDVALLLTGPGLTYSEVIRAGSAHHLVLPWAGGVIVGHWWGPDWTGRLGLPRWIALALLPLAVLVAYVPALVDVPARWEMWTAAVVVGWVFGALLWGQEE